MPLVTCVTGATSVRLASRLFRPQASMSPSALLLLPLLIQHSAAPQSKMGVSPVATLSLGLTYRSPVQFIKCEQTCSGSPVDRGGVGCDGGAVQWHGQRLGRVALWGNVPVGSPSLHPQHGAQALCPASAGAVGGMTFAALGPHSGNGAASGIGHWSHFLHG